MKPKLQARMAALSFAEKIKILERLRDREKAIAASGLRRAGSTGAAAILKQASTKAKKEKG